MSEIEKMYENVGIELIEGLEWVCKNPDHCVYQNLSVTPENCIGCEHFEREMRYPPFTAEKQIELIKWLASKQYVKYTTSLLINIRDTVRFSGGLIAGVCTLNIEYDKQDKDFENALTGLINEMWQDLTEGEKQQVKGILE